MCQLPRNNKTLDLINKNDSSICQLIKRKPLKILVVTEFAIGFNYMTTNQSKS